MSVKVCTRCKIEKNESEFSKDKGKIDGLSCWCKNCQKDYNEARKEKRKLYYEQNKEKIKEKHEIYREQHKEELKIYQQNYDKVNREKRLIRQKQYNESHKKDKQDYYNFTYKEKSREKSKIYREQHKEELRIHNRVYREQHKEELRASDRKRYRENKLNRCMSRNIWHSLKSSKAEQHWEDLVGYSLQDLKEHLEKQFTLEMNWDNYGTYWELDHIVPQNLFSIISADSKDFQICWSLMNLRPLEKSLNRSRPKDGSDISEKLRQAILNQVI